jgi:hypothetical protein
MSVPLFFRLYQLKEYSPAQSGDIVNISWSGVYFFAETRVELGTKLALTVTFPNENTPSVRF